MHTVIKKNTLCNTYIYKISTDCEKVRNSMEDFYQLTFFFYKLIDYAGAGLETPDMIELRKRRIEADMEGGETPSLPYTVIPERANQRIG